MKNYLHLLQKILDHGVIKPDRTGTGTRSLFAERLQFDLKQGFPLLTTKKVAFKSMVTELCWFLRGDTNVQWLQEHGCTIWDEWARIDGDLGPVYGAQWRKFGDDLGPNHGVDQIQQLVDGIKKDPHGRRHVVSAWNPVDIPVMALPPCHCLFQMYVGGPKLNQLSCHMYQRSADVFLGVPFNIASYALLTHVIAAHCQLEVGELTVSFGDVHLYSNHVQQAREQLLRSPKSLPHVSLPPQLATGQSDIFNLDPSQFAIHSYDPYPAIKAPVAV